MTCRRVLQTHLCAPAAPPHRPHLEVAAQRACSLGWYRPRGERALARTRGSRSTSAASPARGRKPFCGRPVRFRPGRGEALCFRFHHQSGEPGGRPSLPGDDTGMAGPLRQARGSVKFPARAGQASRTQPRFVGSTLRRGRGTLFHRSFRGPCSKEAVRQRSHLRSPTTRQAGLYRALPASHRPAARTLDLGQRTQLRPVEAAGLAGQGGRP